MAVVEGRQLCARGFGALQELRVGRRVVAALQRRDLVERRLDLLEPPGLGLQRCQEGVQLVNDLAQGELGLSQRRAGRGELGRQLLERCDEPLGRRDPVGRAVAVVRREGVGRAGRCLDELVDAAQPLALVAQLGLLAGFEA